VRKRLRKKPRITPKGLTGPKGKKSRNKRIKSPYFSKDWYWVANLGGKNESTIFDPSKGGIGKELKIPRIKLIFMVKSSKDWIGRLPEPLTKWKIKAAAIAIIGFIIIKALLQVLASS